MITPSFALYLNKLFENESYISIEKSVQNPDGSVDIWIDIDQYNELQPMEYGYIDTGECTYQVLGVRLSEDGAVLTLHVANSQAIA